MKTLKDLEEMKKEKMVPFGTQYDYFFSLLEDYYITKVDGLSRIKFGLGGWDKEAQKVIVNELIKILSHSGIIGFDEAELLSLIS